MKMNFFRQFFLQEDINFLLTNRVPRIFLTRCMGWFSQIQSPLLTRWTIRIWRLFTTLDLSDAQKQSFGSLHECFTRELLPGSRPVDADAAVLCSPCDAIVGAYGQVVDGMVMQAKGFPYSVAELFGPSQDTSDFKDGCFVTLRLTSAMYHRFHAPHDLQVEHVTYISGDTWNVNPIALQRVERLFCRNERAVLRTRLTATGHPVALVPVAAILVASMRFHFLDVLMNLRYRGANEIPCAARFSKGQELGWFEHGSTIILFAPADFKVRQGIQTGQALRMGQALLHLPQALSN